MSSIAAKTTRRHPKLRYIPYLLGLTYGLVSVAAHAQTSPSESTPQRTAPVIVIGNPLAGEAPTSAITVLSGDALLLRRGNTLGDTLAGLPGVGTTFFGPNSGRPTIRGLDGDRVKVLSNMGASLDASTISYDHNPTIDPLMISRVEVLRGPAALLYGGTAIGGAVNVVDNRIPATPVSGVRGEVEARAGGADKERSSAAVLEAGNGVATLHIDGFNRDRENYRVPSATGLRSPVVNSSADARGGAIGAALAIAGGRGNVGLSHSTFDTNYGTVAEEAVRIDMRQKRTAVEFSLGGIDGLVESFFLKSSRSDYRHQELEDGAVGTTFTNVGDDVRAEFRHRRFGAMQGVVGVQAESFEFAAIGDEAFVPRTKTRNRALFVFEELALGDWRWSAGGRWESSKVTSAGAELNTSPRFGTASGRDFSQFSSSFSAAYRVHTALTLTSNLAFSKRAPTYYELFADGPHVATAAYEVGDRGIAAERSRALDLNLKWRSGEAKVDLSAFVQDFPNFIALRRSGEDRDTEGNRSVVDCGDGTSVASNCQAEILPEYRYEGVPARFVGVEFDAAMPLVRGGYGLDLTAKIDYVRAQDRRHGEPMPRISPLRATLGLAYVYGGLRLTAELDHAAAQNRVPALDSGGSTGSHTLINASALYRVAMPQNRSATFFLRATNLTDRAAFNATSIDTVRRLSPLPGRALKAGVRLEF